MASSSALLRRVERLRQLVGRPGDPRHWIFALTGDHQIPDLIRSQINPQDTVFIRRIIADWIDDPPHTCTVVTTAKRNYIVDMQSGQWSEVTRSI